MKGLFLILILMSPLLLNHPLEAYQRLNKNTKAYHYTQPRPYWNKPAKQWDRTAYKSYFYYDHEVYPQYTYVYPGHYFYYGYPYYYDNDNGRIYSYWGY
jgi:hypothetical protein